MPPTGECEALFDYESDNLGDLTFAAGEKIVITEWVGDEWLTGRIGEERNGMFPLSFVKITKELPKDSMSKGTVKFIPFFVCTSLFSQLLLQSLRRRLSRKSSLI